MKRTITLIRLLPIMMLVILLTGSGINVKATNLLTDDFSGTVATALTANGWTLHSGSGTPFLISSPGLSYISYLGTGIGNAASTAGTSDDINKAFTSTNSGSLFLAFMYKPTSANTTTDYPVMFGATSGTSVTSFFGKLYVQKDASNNVRFGITKSTAASASYSGYTYSLNTTYLIIIKYTFVSGTANDAVSLFVNPVLGGTEPSATVTGATDAAADPAQLISICLRQSTTTAGAVYDGFRVGTTWADVASSGTVVAPTIQASSINFTSIGQTGMTANWTIGDGAKRVVIMNNSNSFTAPTDGTDPTAITVYSGSGEQVVYNGAGNSVGVTGLSPATTYYFRVYEYNGSSTTTKYLTTSSTNNPNSQTTNAATSPVITVLGTINTFSSTVINTTSLEQIYTLQGSNLTDNIVITPPAGFEISKTSGSAFVTNPGTLIFTPVEVAAAQNVYVRFAPTAVQAYGGNISHNSTGATQVDKALSGTGVNAEPTNHATTFTATANSSSQITVTWTDAIDGQLPAGYLIKASTGTPTVPVDGTTEIDGTLVKNITQGTKTVVFTGLSASTTYNFSIWPYTNSGNTINYKTDGTVPTSSAATSIAIVVGAAVTLRPSYIDISSTTSESAVLMTLSNYSSNDVKYRLYATNQYSCWDETTDAYITSSTYSAGPSVPGTSTTSTTFWIVFQRGTNATTGASYRDRLGTGYTSNYQTVVLPDATSITTGFAIAGKFIGTQTYNNTVKQVVLAYSGATLISASSTTLSTGAFSVVCPTGTSIDKIEIRAIDNTLILSSTGSWSSASNLGDLPLSTFSGTGDWSETARWNSGTVPGATQIVVVDGVATINSNVVVAGLTINSGKSLTINAAKQFTVSGSAINNGSVTLQSDLTGTGTIVGDVTGAATVNQFLSGYRTWYMSSPVSNVAPGNMDRYKFYDETTNTWPATAPVQTIGAGFLAVPTDNTVTSTSFSGSLNNGDISIPLTSTTGVVKAGFNLIGNPYPSYLDWTAVYAANTSNLSTSTLWYRTKSTGAYTFWTVNGQSGEGSPLEASKYIPPMQAFWVRTANATGSLNLTNSLRGHAPVGGSLLKAPAVNSNTLIRLEVSNGTNRDEAVLYFNDNASNGFDAYDSPKMSNEDVSIPEIFTRAGSEQLVINGMPSMPKDTEIALGFEAGDATSFSLRANELRNLPSDVKVILKDNVTNTETDLTNGTTAYQFAPIATTADRFSVIFRTASIATGLENPVNDGILVYSNSMNQLTISCKAAINAPSFVSVCNSVGQRLASQRLNSNITVIDRTFIPGVYIVKVNNVTKRVVVK